MSKASIRNRSELRRYRCRRHRSKGRYERGYQCLNRTERVELLTSLIRIRMPNCAIYGANSK